MQIAKDKSGRVLKLAGSLEIGVAEELQSALRHFVLGAARPIVDLSEVDACDTAALQLLCSARKTADHSGKPFEITGLSDAVRSASAALGLPLAEAPGAHPATRGDRDAV